MFLKCSDFALCCPPLQVRLCVRLPFLGQLIAQRRKLIPQDSFLCLRPLRLVFQLRRSRTFRFQQNQRFRERLRLSILPPRRNLIARRKVEPLHPRMSIPPHATALAAKLAVCTNTKG